MPDELDPPGVGAHQAHQLVPWLPSLASRETKDVRNGGVVLGGEAIRTAPGHAVKGSSDEQERVERRMHEVWSSEHRPSLVQDPKPSVGMDVAQAAHRFFEVSFERAAEMPMSFLPSVPIFLEARRESIATATSNT